MAAALELLQAGPVRAMLYRDVPWHSIVADLADNKKYPHHAVIVLELLQPSWGHYWALLRRGQGLKVVELFDSTGRRPDALRARLTPAAAAALGQAGTPLTDALRRAEQDGLELRYNNRMAQPDLPSSVTCGWWALLRSLNSELNEYDFLRKVQSEAGAGGFPDLDAFVCAWGERESEKLCAAHRKIAETNTGGQMSRRLRPTRTEVEEAERDAEARPLSTLPKEALDIVDMLRVPGGPAIVEADCRLVGSFVLRAQPYPSDIDIDQRILIAASTSLIPKILAEAVQGVVRRISKKKGAWFSDCKAGRRGGEGLHWTQEEVLAGRHATGMSLVRACEDRDAVLKVDMIVPLLGRYVEASSFYHARTPDGPYNYKEQSVHAIVKELVADATVLIHKDPPKLLKSVKRLYSAARLTRDMPTMEALNPILRSGASALGTAGADLETVSRIVELGGLPDRRIVESSTELLVFRLSSVTDVDGFDPAGFAAEAKTAVSFLYAGDTTAYQQVSERLQAALRGATNRYVRSYMARAPDVTPRLRKLYA